MAIELLSPLTLTPEFKCPHTASGRQLEKHKTNMADYYQQKKRNVSKSRPAKDSELLQLKKDLSRSEDVQLKTKLIEIRSEQYRQRRYKIQWRFKVIY